LPSTLPLSYTLRSFSPFISNYYFIGSVKQKANVTDIKTESNCAAGRRGLRKKEQPSYPQPECKKAKASLPGSQVNWTRYRFIGILFSIISVNKLKFKKLYNNEREEGVREIHMTLKSLQFNGKVPINV
jgi:hypothetical protein